MSANLYTIPPGTPALSVCKPGDYSDYGGKSIVIESVERRVAVVLGRDAEAKRIARLFAASPDLLKFAEIAIPFLEAFRIGADSNERFYEFMGGQLAIGRAAIAKAKGEA